MTKGKVFITGAAGGIGYETSKIFAEKGYLVYAAYHSGVGSLEELASKYPENIIPLQLDVTEGAQIEAVAKQVGSIDVLVNNAGIAEFKPFLEMSEQDWDRMLTVNLKSVFLCTKAFIQVMEQRKTGKIINISSVWGVTGGSCEVHYSTAKAGIIGFTKALAKEMGTSGIQVNCIAPGVIDTPMNAGLSDDDRHSLEMQTPLGKIGTARAVAEGVLFLAENDFITGEILNINGGFAI